MKTFKKILFLVVVLSIPLLTYSGDPDNGYEPTIREIRLQFFDLSQFGGLDGGLYPNNYWSPIKEPHNFDFYSSDATYIDVLKLMRDVPYGTNNYSNSGVTYYYMHGSSGLNWDCIDKDNIEVGVEVAPDNHSIVTLSLDIGVGQRL